MLILSPSKGQDFTTPPPAETHTDPLFSEYSLELIAILRNYSQEGLSELMNISGKLAALNENRYKKFQLPFTPENAKQAIFSFTGDVYRGIEANQYSTSELNFAQKNLRILSGLYGMLRPLDLMQPYRLEMKTPLENKLGKNLYAFWGTKITDALNEEIKSADLSFFINLASVEYSKVIQRKKLSAPMLDVAFKEQKGDSIRSIAVFAKRARGLMANYIIKNKITNLEMVKQFNLSNYSFSPSNSDDTIFTFIRPQPE